MKARYASISLLQMIIPSSCPIALQHMLSTYRERDLNILKHKTKSNEKRQLNASIPQQLPHVQLHLNSCLDMWSPSFIVHNMFYFLNSSPHNLAHCVYTAIWFCLILKCSCASCFFLRTWNKFRLLRGLVLLGFSRFVFLTSSFCNVKQAPYFAFFSNCPPYFEHLKPWLKRNERT